jgi:hypothetical protein
VAISLPPTVLLNEFHVAVDGQHVSPGKQRHEEAWRGKYFDLANQTELARTVIEVQATI